MVSYNSREHLGRCLRSLDAAGVERIVVVDNASTDGSGAALEGTPAEWVESGGNLGYGRAANLGAAHGVAAGSDYLLICNPDVVVEADAVARLAAVLDADPAVGIVGPRVTNPDGSLYPSARTFPDMVDAMGHGLLGLVAPRNRFTRRYRLLDWDHSARAGVDWVSGACFLARRLAWDDVGGFDPVYFMYMEDVDLCWRVGRAGWTVVYEPAAAVLHVQGVSADLHPYRMLAAHHHSMWVFARRTTTGTRRAVLPVVAAGLAGRLVVACARRAVAGPRRRRRDGRMGRDPSAR